MIVQVPAELRVADNSFGLTLLLFEAVGDPLSKLALGLNKYIG